MGNISFMVSPALTMLRAEHSEFLQLIFAFVHLLAFKFESFLALSLFSMTESIRSR